MLMRILICWMGIQPRLYETLGLISSTLNPDLVAAYAWEVSGRDEWVQGHT